jgi:hypothetical protein
MFSAISKWEMQFKARKCCRELAGNSQWSFLLPNQNAKVRRAANSTAMMSESEREIRFSTLEKRKLLFLAENCNSAALAKTGIRQIQAGPQESSRFFLLRKSEGGQLPYFHIAKEMKLTLANDSQLSHMDRRKGIFLAGHWWKKFEVM